MENINYTSSAYVFVSNHMFNSCETSRTVNIGRTLPSDIQWNLYGGATYSTTNTYTFRFNTYELWGNSYPSDNSVPDHWVRYTTMGSNPVFTYSNKDAIGAIPRFTDKVLMGVGHDTKVVIKQARPLYVGKVNGSHYIATNYEPVDTSNQDSAGYYYPYSAYASTHWANYPGTAAVNYWHCPKMNEASAIGAILTTNTATTPEAPTTILNSAQTAYETNTNVLHSMYRFMHAATSSSTLQYFYNIPRPASYGASLTGDQYYYQFRTIAVPNYTSSGVPSYVSCQYSTGGSWVLAVTMTAGSIGSCAYSGPSTGVVRPVRTINYDY